MGVLSGYKVIEMAGVGPGPMAGMLLADMGAEVVRVERSARVDPLFAKDVSARGKRSIVLNLKSDEGLSVLRKLIDSADVLLEGFRPGVAERLGFGPEDCAERNPRLVFGRVTGWGQSGPLAQAPGHDLNYIALTGALHAIGPPNERPAVPLNLVGDFAGGALFLVSGILGALLEREKSGQGQVVDAAMIDGTANLLWMVHSFHAVGQWNIEQRGVNVLDGGAFFYDTYETSDGKHIALGAIEPQFFAELVRLVGLDESRFNAKTQLDPTQWASLRAELAAEIKKKSQAQWCELLEGSDACFAPVLTIAEAPAHPHNAARDAYVEVDSVTQPAPAPRFSRTPSSVAHGQHAPGQDTQQILSELGFDRPSVEGMRAAGSVDWP